MPIENRDTDPIEPFTPEEQRALGHCSERIHGLALSGGLSAQAVTNAVKAMKDHPDFSSDILQVLFDEVEELLRIAPGVGLIDIDGASSAYF